MITSRQNPRIKEFMQLAKRSRDGRVLSEGVHLLKEALESGVEIESVLVAPRRAGDEVEETVSLARSRGIEIVEMSEDCYKKFSQLKSSENVAMIFRFSPYDLSAFLSGNKRIVLLDSIQDPGNAGAIVRIAEAAGMDGCVFIGGASITNGKFLRASMGAVFRVPCVNVDFAEFSAATERSGLRIIVTELDDTAKAFRDVSYAVESSSVGICFGSEGQGVTDELLGLAEERIYIPMAGKVESLNVAVAAGIVLYHVGFGS